MGLFRQKKEETLEKEGKFNALQKHRLKKASYRDIMVQLPKFLKTEHKLQEIVQRELALAQDSKKYSTPSGVEAIEKEKQELKRKYFFADREWHQIHSSFTSPCVLRALHFWRSDPQWYMHKSLVRICVERGGCCARNCGCCRTRYLRSNRRLGVGHCTAECRCCQDSVDCVLKEGVTQEITNLYIPDRHKNYGYYKEVMRASVFGLATSHAYRPFFGYMDSDTTNPFDLIEKPPRYKAIP